MNEITLKNLKPLVNNRDLWNLLDSYLELCYNTSNPKIDSSSGEEVYRLQGERRFITRLRKLREQVNDAE